MRHVDKTHDPDLFRACRGAGGGNFGVITGYGFDKLPSAPSEVAGAGISFDWSDHDRSTLRRDPHHLRELLGDRAASKKTLGACFPCSGYRLKRPAGFGISLQFCNPDGTCSDLSVVNEFLDRFDRCKPIPGAPSMAGDRKIHVPKLNSKSCAKQHSLCTPLA